ncbi:unnamed protein product [Auanema sp. JU1783]|nr:unnamed protein product [Auanema sp. JU1783]
MNHTVTFENPFDKTTQIPWLFIVAPPVIVTWVIFLTFYLSRVVGLLFSFVLNRYLRFTKTAGHIKVGSISLSVLGGKVMFRELVFANDDYSIRINDGWLIFSYWKNVPKTFTFHDPTSRLHVSLNGLQIHWYNRVHQYKEIAKLFHLERLFGDEECRRIVPTNTELDSSKAWDRFWALVGVIKMDIWSGRVVIGNKSLPYMFVFSWENMTSKVLLEPSAADKALLKVSGQMESIRVSLLKHPEYAGLPYKEPPRTMGDGFAVMQSANLMFYYHQDILGYVTEEQQSASQEDAPVWESIFRFGSNTVMGYGPWVEQQRALIYSFFFPPDYQTAAVSALPTRGSRRINIIHDCRISFLKETAIDVWFMRGEQLESVHTRCQPGSSADISIWWITLEDGYSWSCEINLLTVASTTSLVYRKLFECETLSVVGNFHYPRVYNGKQTWKFNYNISKATAWFVWDHKRFFSDLINEWIGDAPSDVLTFIPYTVANEVKVTDGFEFILLLNDSNWVDPSEKLSENVECAIVGEQLSLSFLYAFVDFLPSTFNVSYNLIGENEMAMRLKYPSNSATSSLLAGLLKNAKTSSNANVSPHGTVSKAEGWFESWRTERVSCVFDYKYHPIITEFKPTLPYDVYKGWMPPKIENPFDLPVDFLKVVVDIEGSEVMLTGLLIRFLIDLKNNYFGYYDSMTSIESVEAESSNLLSMFNRVPPNAIAELYRPMDVEFELRVHNIRAQCLLHSPSTDEPCPTVFTEEIAVEIKKSCKETFIQVGVGPCVAHFERTSSNQSDGFLTLSGLQFRGHAMFSSVDVPWDMSILEYGWIMEIIIGDIRGSLNFPNNLVALEQVVESLLIMAISKDDAMIIPNRFNICQHGQLVTSCKKSKFADGRCDGEEKLKYRQLRLSVDSVQLALCEEKTIIQVAADPIRFTLCNLHEGRFAEHLCIRVPEISIKQILHVSNNEQTPTWLLVSKATISGIVLDLELPIDEADNPVELAGDRLEFLRKHDEKSHRLLFIWSNHSKWRCTCNGGTYFFGEVDTIGKDFLRTDHKLCIPDIVTNGQPGVLQDLLRPTEMMLHAESHYIYGNVKSSRRKDSTDSFKVSAVSSLDTASFHSTFSHQLEESSHSLLATYTGYLAKVDVFKKDCEPPSFGEPGDIALWAQKRIMYLNIACDGVDTLKMKPSKATEFISATHKQLNSLTDHRLIITGSAAKAVDVFISPLSFEAADIIVNSCLDFLPQINPFILLNSIYRDCLLRSHKQPLTKTLFPSDNASPFVFDVALDLPTVHISMFQCGVYEYYNKPSLENKRISPVSSNLAFAFIHGGSIKSKPSPFGQNVQSTNYTLNITEVSAQLLQVLSNNEQSFVPDFSRVQTLSQVDWESSSIAKRIHNKYLSLVLDFGIPEINIILEKLTKISSKKNHPNLSNQSSLQSTKVLEDKLKIDIGSIKALVTMPKPLDRTSKQEFPLYDVLSPAINSWLGYATKLERSLSQLTDSMSTWSDISMIRIMKLALECTDEAVLGGKNKNVMEPAKVFGKHQASCPSCLLLHNLMRWCSLPSSQASALPLTSYKEFRDVKSRKVALQALLSHWQTDICRLVKLASTTDAMKYKVEPRDTKKREVRIQIDEHKEHRRSESGVSRTAVMNDSTLQGNDANVTKKATETESKSNLYQWIMNAHRERNERREGKSMEEINKDYINPMDIVPRAFFYPLYKSYKLDVTQLDSVPFNNMKVAYTVNINGIYADLVEPKTITSSSCASEFSTASIHHLMQVKLLSVNGDFGWKTDMDERNLIPKIGKATLNYRGSIEDVQFVVALSSICLAKEIFLVVKTASDILASIKQDTLDHERLMKKDSPMNQSVKDSSENNQTWEDRVIELTNDFEKTMTRSGDFSQGNILISVHGALNVDAVKLESQLTDLYISFDMRTIELTQQHNPSNREAHPQEVDILKFSLRKAKLNIREAILLNGKMQESKPILHCGLKESVAKLDRKLLVLDGRDPKSDTSLFIALGAIDGELPMVARSLHDVVMRHGPELEQQFNRLSAQPHAHSNSDTLLKVQPIGSPTDWVHSSTDRVIMTRPTIARVSFQISLDSIELKAQLLPSLKATYKLHKATSSGETGAEAKWMAAIEDHHAEFYVSLDSKSGDNFNLALPSVSVKGQYLGEEKCIGGTAPTTDKQLRYRQGGYLKMEVLLGQVNHSFTTDLLNHILFAEQSFRSELSALIQRLGPQTPSYPETTIPTTSTENKSLLFFLTIKGQGVPWFQLTAATPSSTAVRFTIDSLDTELTNRWVVKEEGSTRERLFGAAVIQFNAKLGQLVKPAQYEEIQAELQEYATFMTQIRIENKESSKKTYSYHISLNRPFFMLKASAIDKGILLWLNYKNTYDYWRAERTKFERASSTKRNSIPHAMFSPQQSQDFDINLSLSINNGMYVCMPLISNDVTEGMPALVLSLQKSDVTVTIRKELVCQAQFHGFKLNFIDNFDERSLSSVHENRGDSNFFFFPQGSYQLCSKASNESGDAQWILSVRSRMRGMIIDLDHRIGKLTKMLVNTLSSLGEDDENYIEDFHSDYIMGTEEQLIEGGAELSRMVPEDRIRWLERKMHEQSKKVSDLMMRKMGEKELEIERRKLRQYELIRFKEFRRTMIEKLRRKNDRGKRASATSEALGVPSRVSSTHRESSDADNQKQGRPQDTVNMHIDVQVSIETGTCTLKTAPKPETTPNTLMVKRPSARDLRAKNIGQPPVSVTMFSIPSVDLKAYYVSIDNIENIAGFAFPRKLSAQPSNANERTLKRGCIYLSVALSSMPSETVVTPHLADYVEQVLEPLPVFTEMRAESMESLGDSPETMNNIVGIDTSVLPIDVLFYLTVQSSTIRFDGQQQKSSAADCLLKLPCLTLMASTRRTEGDEYLGGVDISVTLSAFSLSIYSPHQQSTSRDALAVTLDHLSLVISRSKNASSEPDNRVRFVLTSNIGAANFTYDIWRLSELLQFPKPWYRRAIARRIFFGDQAAPGRDNVPSRPSTIASQNYVQQPRSAIQEKPWYASVLLAIQWKELNVNGQMSNTMGSTSWKARKGLLRSFAKLNYKHERDITVTFLLDSSELIAHGGAISGEIALSQLLLSATHKRLEKGIPRNKLHFELLSLSTRIEWMSRAVLISRIDHPRIILGDDIIETNHPEKGSEVAVLLNINGSWRDLQIVINKNTIDDFMKIVNKLQTFFHEQLRSSRRAWVFADDDAGTTSHTKETTDTVTDTEKEVLFTDHWEKVLDLVTEIQYNLKLIPLPMNGQTVVGGAVQLDAGRLSIACMHGEMNANSWAVFHLKELSILFKPNAKFKYTNEEQNTLGVAVNQRLIISLGESSDCGTERTENMANVCRVQLTRNLLRQNSSIKASLDYIIGDVLKIVKPSADPTEATSTTNKSQHNVLELFQFPALKALLTSLQCNECDMSSDTPVKPEVLSSFVCEFYNLVYVQTDFSAQVSFLPELLKSYINATANQNVTGPETPTKKYDNRDYKCEKWEVNPKIGFIDRTKWNPPLVDDILRKLQIFDHRTTIPKALQRAVLDPLDATLAIGIAQMFKLVHRGVEDELSNKNDGR